ncbi:MAG TPA: rRNA maturation RNase YbeY [Granulicella sp.]|jgi:probable rRNA maturation factor|nr:rRNA maturation RNase YbeY [Granulicella sp.]
MITIDPPSSSPSHKSTAASSSSALPLDGLSRSGLTRFLNRARCSVGLAGEVEVLLTGDAELKRLNRTFRGKNKATDVLSFPTPAEIADHNAGDLAISLETAARQANAFGHSLRDEIRILLLHGLLHLSGLDHETDSGEMAAREAELRRELRLPNGLIARTEAPKAQPKAAKQRPRPRTAKLPALKKPTPSKPATRKLATGKPRRTRS